MIKISFVEARHNQFWATKMTPYFISKIARYLSKTDPDLFVENLYV